jgi:glycosyltransferase involved in cell wall biosynthesis
MEEKKTRVAIISAGYKNVEMSRKFINHITKSKQGDNVESKLYFVWAEENPQAIVTLMDWIENELHIVIPNKSFSNSMNTGLKEAMKEDFDYYLVIGNDGFPQTENWLSLLIETSEKAGFGIISPEADNPPLEAYNHRFLMQHKHLRFYSMYPAICWLLPRAVVRRVGLFDENFEVGCYEDDDYARRVILSGGKIIVDTRVKLQHLLSQTMKLFDVNEVMAKNEKIFREKWDTIERLSKEKKNE